MKKLLTAMALAGMVLGGGTFSSAATVLSPAVWDEFYFYGAGTVVEETWEFDLPAGYSLYVTDAFLSGDQFAVYNDGVPLGLTSYVPTGIGGYKDPQVAYDSGLFSRGEFPLSAGYYGNIHLLVELSPHGSGGAFIKIDHSSLSPVPEPATMVLLGAGLLGLTAVRREKSSR